MTSSRAHPPIWFATAWFDVTGARWSVAGAEAILKLRAVRSNGDWPAYWQHHLAQEHRRVHESRYEDGIIPKVA